MGRKSWATEKQHQWLVDNIPKFREAQSQKKVREFRQEVLAAYFQKFPLKITEQDSDDEETAIDDDEESDIDYTKAPSLRVARDVRFLPSFIIISKGN